MFTPVYSAYKNSKSEHATKNNNKYTTNSLDWENLFSINCTGNYQISVFFCQRNQRMLVYFFLAVGNYMFKVNNRNTRTRCEICSKLTIKTSERRHWRRSGVFIVNFEHISHLVLKFLLLTLSR